MGIFATPATKYVFLLLTFLPFISVESSQVSGVIALLLFLLLHITYREQVHNQNAIRCDTIFFSKWDYRNHFVWIRENFILKNIPHRVQLLRFLTRLLCISRYSYVPSTVLLSQIRVCRSQVPPYYLFWRKHNC